MNRDLTVGKPESVLWKFCVPLFGSIIFQQLYNIADSFVAGKFIGENALAAVGNSYEITLIFIAFAFVCAFKYLKQEDILKQEITNFISQDLATGNLEVEIKTKVGTPEEF